MFFFLMVTEILCYRLFFHYHKANIYSQKKKTKLKSYHYPREQIKEKKKRNEMKSTTDNIVSLRDISM